MLQMRHLLVILFVSALALLSCGRPDYPAELLAADSLSGVRPDSAKAVLGRVGHGLDAFDDAARWYYRLLRLKVRGKAYDVFTAADSAEAFDILAHYRSGGDSRLLPQAYYYAGCVVRDMGNAPMAIDLFQQGMDAMQDTTDLELRSILNFRIGFLLLDQGVYDHAIPYFRESLRLESLRKDTAMMAFCHEKLAFVYRDKGERDSALCYFDRAIRCANALGDSTFANGFVASLASYYISVKDYRKADSCLAPYLPYVDAVDKIPIYGMMAVVCMNTGRYDEGYSYCSAMLGEGSILSKQNACRMLLLYYSHYGDIENVSKYVSLLSEYTDSLDKVTARDVVARMNTSYNYNFYRVENAELKAEKARSFGIIWALGLAVIMIMWLYLRHVRVSHRRAEERELRWASLQHDMQEMSDASIKEKEEKISMLEVLLKEAKEQSEEQLSQLIQQKRQLELLVSMANKKREMSDAIRKQIVNSKVYANVHKMARENRIMTYADWEEVDSFVKELMPNFKNGLYSISDISEQDYRLCLLMRLGGFTGKEMAVLLGRTDGAVSKAKRKLQERFLGGDNDKKNLESFILSL